MMDDYELRYLRAVMEWLNEGGCYEPHDINELYRDWKERVSKGEPSAPRFVRDFTPPEGHGN